MRKFNFKLTNKVRREIKLHLFFFSFAWVLVPLLWGAFELGLFPRAPAEFVMGYGLFMEISFYLWWRQGFSADKTEFKPRIWK